VRSRGLLSCSRRLMGTLGRHLSQACSCGRGHTPSCSGSGSSLRLAWLAWLRLLALHALEHGQPALDLLIRRVKRCCCGVSIDRIGDLVAALV
jgi:hypothetical protein